MIEHVIEAMIDTVLVVDAEGHITLSNSAATKITGFTAEELRAVPVAKVLTDETSGGGAARLASVVHSGPAARG